MSARHPWYGTARWQKLRLAQLRHEPTCRLCKQKHPPRITPATVADHITPHRGDHTLFWYGELQSLCDDCHNTTKQTIEKRGYDTRVDERGLPLDPNHPFRKRP